MPSLPNDFSALRGLLTTPGSWLPEPDTGGSTTCAALARGLMRLRKTRLQSARLALILPHLMPFCASRAKWRIVDGGNRASKTFVCLVEAARAFLGCDPYDKYPVRDGNALIVGQDEDAVARIWKGLSKPGAFWLIPDEITGELRAVRYDRNNPLVLDPQDLARRDEWKPAPPFLPENRWMGRPAWSDTRKEAPRLLRMKNGWTILFRSSNGEPPQGDRYDFVWFDEQLLKPEFYNEASRGLTGLADRPKKWMPKGIWSATAQVTNMQLDQLRAQAESGAKHVQAYHTTVDQNPFVLPEEKKAFFDSLEEDDREVRYYGISRLRTKRIYGMYQPNGTHGVEPHPVPPDACRYVVVDPGLDHCGCLFIYLDPEEQYATVYDGFDLRHAGASEWAAAVAQRQTDMCFEAAVIDQRRGRQGNAEKTDTYAAKYFAALREAGVHVRRLGSLSGFIPGSDNTEYREQALLNMLSIRGSGPFAGTAKLRVVKGCCPKLDEQILNAHTDPKKPNKRARNAGPEDVLVCLEMFAGCDLQYYKPEPIKLKEDLRAPTVFDRFKQKKERQRRRRRKRTLVFS